jgi:hypothetical protein
LKRLPQVGEGALRAFLASYKAPPLTLHAVYPPTQHLAVKVRLFIDFLVGRTSGVPAWSAKVWANDCTGIDMERPLVADSVAKVFLQRPTQILRAVRAAVVCRPLR